MNTLRIALTDSPDDLLDAGAFGAGALLRLEKSADGITYGSETTTPIVSNQMVYRMFDTAGVSTTWYRWRVSNSGGTNFSEFAAPFQLGEGPERYTTLALVRARLKKAVADTTDDARIEEIVQDTNYWVETFIGTPVGPSTATQMILDGCRAVGYPQNYSNWTGRGDYIYVKRGVRSVSLVEMRYSTSSSWTTVDSTNALLYPVDGERDPGWPPQYVRLIGPTYYYWYDGNQNVRLTGVFGFAQVPPDIREVATVLAMRSYLNMRAGQQDLTGLDEQGQIAVSRYLSYRDRMTLQRYRDGTRRWYD